MATRRPAVKSSGVSAVSSRELRRYVSQMLEGGTPCTAFRLARTIHSLNVFPQQSLNQLRLAIEALGVVHEHNKKRLARKTKNEFFAV